MANSEEFAKEELLNTTHTHYQTNTHKIEPESRHSNIAKIVEATNEGTKRECLTSIP